LPQPPLFPPHPVPLVGQALPDGFSPYNRRKKFFADTGIFSGIPDYNRGISKEEELVGMRMTTQEMLDYIKKHNNRSYNSKEAVKEASDKIISIMEQFNFKLYESFNVRCRNWNREDTSWYYRYNIAEYEYIEVQIGWVYKYTGKKITGHTGLCRVTPTKVSLNPETGKPWKIGDIDRSTPEYPRTLTKRGWYTGD